MRVANPHSLPDFADFCTVWSIFPIPCQSKFFGAVSKSGLAFTRTDNSKKTAQRVVKIFARRNEPFLGNRIIFSDLFFGLSRLKLYRQNWQNLSPLYVGVNQHS